MLSLGSSSVCGTMFFLTTNLSSLRLSSTERSVTGTLLMCEGGLSSGFASRKEIPDRIAISVDFDAVRWPVPSTRCVLTSQVLWRLEHALIKGVWSDARCGTSGIRLTYRPLLNFRSKLCFAGAVIDAPASPMWLW